MSKRKFLAVFLLLILPVALTAGCSQAEQGFLNLQKELSELNTYETSGDFVVSCSGLPALADAKSVSPFLQNMLQKGVTINFTGKTDLEKEIMDCTFTLVPDTTNTEQISTRIICKGDTLYLQIDELIKLMQALGDSETSNKLKDFFGEAQYVSMTTEEYYQSLGIDELQELPLINLKQNSFMNSQQTKLLQKLILEIPNAYQNYSTGLATQSGNTYTWEVKGADALKVLIDFLKYNLNNSQDIVKWAVSFLDSLNDEEFAYLGLDPEQKYLYETMLNIAVADIEENKEKYLQGINSIETELLEDNEIKKFLDGFKITCSLSKNEQGVYTSAINYALNFNEADLQLNLQLKGQAQTKKAAPFTVNIPSTKVMTYTEYLNKVTKTIEIQVDSNTYTFTDSKGSTRDYLEVKNIEGFTYLPMRQIAELLGEKVGWDAEQSQAYVLRNGEKIDMTGVIIAGHTYIKTRDFLKLNYEVDWNDTTRTATISTISF
ncbi:MAG TPA: hypothetical protein GX532_06000 [Clostridia bacterium]|jgi:hypothetical protein|nr:stalk domain-containing protein [Clostridia bacterium]HHY06510.1 hypothetical protein [Clostridia bacterium]